MCDDVGIAAMGKARNGWEAAESALSEILP